MLTEAITNKGVWVLNKHTLQFKHVNTVNRFFTSAFYARNEAQVYMGGIDGIVKFTPEILEENTPGSPIVITEMYINNQPFDREKYHQEKSIRYVHNLKLKYNQNNLALGFSDFDYSEEDKNKFVYRLHGLDDNFKGLEKCTNRITYVNLDPGDYQLFVKSINEKKELSDLPPIMEFEILPPWYYTWAAKAVYLLLLATLILWTINFFKVKNRLRLERLEKEKLSELSKLKINFFTDISHEFKTPLSLILAPISKLITEVKSKSLKEQLKLIKRNALKLCLSIKHWISIG